jgi:hypothetical protein
MKFTIPKQVYFFSKVFCVVLFTYCLIELRLNAGMARKWYYNNWCPLGEPCKYWVGSVWDYVFLTSSSFHDGWTLLHVGLVSSVVLLIIVLLIEISDRGVR